MTGTLICNARRSLLILVVLLLLQWTSESVAQVQLDRFYPPAVAIGAETAVKAEGKFPTWPVEVVCDRNEIKFALSEDSGLCRVTVPPRAAPGVAWIRMHDPLSASKLVPLLIEPRPPLSETEPNNSIDQSTKVELPSVLIGRLAKSGDVDTFRVSVGSGQTLVVSAMAHRALRSPMDAVLQLVDTGGNVIVQSDDARWLDPQIVHQVKNDTELLIRIFAFPETPNSTIGYAGAASYVYTLRVTADGFVDHVLPLVVTDDDSSGMFAHGWNLPADAKVRQFPASGFSPITAYVPDSLGWQWQVRGPSRSTSLFERSEGSVPAGADVLPSIFSGHLGQPGEVDRVRFHVEKGLKYRASVHSRSFGLKLDSVLRIVDAKDGGELARNDDRARSQYDAAVDYTAKFSGEVELQISDLVAGSGAGHAYSVVIQQVRPRVELSLAADHFAVTAGQSLEVPVAVTRLHGFNQNVRITAENLPAGVRAEPVVSEIKGSTAKSIKLKLIAQQDTAYQGTFKIVGEVVNERNDSTQRLVAVHRLRELVSLEDIWLTVAPTKP